MMKTFLLFLGALGMSAALAVAETAAATEAPIEPGKILTRTYLFKEAEKRMDYALYVPTSFKAGKPMPLVVLLHGWGSNAHQVIRYQGIVEEAEKRGYIIVAPQGYNAFGWYGALGPGRKFKAGIPAPGDSPESLGQLSEHDVLNVLGLVRAELPIDPARIYLMGHSMGGGGTFYLGIKYAQNWAALAGLAPAVFSDPTELTKIPHMPIIVVQGDKDRLVDTAKTRLWIAEMEKLGLPHEYMEIKGGDHIFSITTNPQMIAKVFDFFAAHHR